MLKKILAVAIALVIASCVSNHRSDAHFRSKAVKLTSPNGLCSGEQVKAPSGENYILTAGHCHALADAKGDIMAVTEDGKKISRHILAEDPESDLMIIEGLPGVEGLPIAEDLDGHDWVRTYTHGGGMDTYRTEGYLVQDATMKALVSPIETDEEAKACEASGPKMKAVEIPINMGFISFVLRACVIEVEETVSTAPTIPGSSGGMVINRKGELVGVVSAGGEGFSWFVKLSDIKRFLAAY